MSYHYRFAAAAALLILINSNSSSATEPVIVTATRTAETADSTLAPVTVITREDIERSPALDLRELLVGTPWLEATTNGPYGKTTGFFMRGTNSDQVLTLVDGVKLYSATLGSTAFQHIPLNQIERIEIVRGPRSALYGAEAIGGVIQIFTRRGQEQTVGNARVGGGSNSTAELDGGISGALGAGTYSVQASAIDTDGINVTDFQPDRDGYDNQSLSASVGYSVGETGEIRVQLLRAEGDTAFDNPFDPPDAVHDSDFVQQVTSARLDLNPTAAWFTRVQIGNSRDESKNFTDGAFFSKFDTGRDEISWQNDIQVGAAHLLTLGLDYSDDRVGGSTEYDVDSRDNLGVFGQWQGDFGRNRLIAALRNDDNEQFGTQTTGSVDYGFNFNERLRVTVGTGTGFKAPSFNQLFFPDFGNPALKPEESTSVEVGLAGSSGETGRWALRLFDTEIDDLIVTDLDTFRPKNIDKADIVGLEAEYGSRAGQWDWSAALTLLDPEDRATGKVLRRRSRETLRVDAGRPFGNWRVNLSALAQGKRYEDAANTIELDGYALVDANLIYAFTTQWDLGLYAQNLFDEDYQTADGFNQKGRTAMLRLRYRTN